MDATLFPHVSPSEVMKDASTRASRLDSKKAWTAQEMRGGHKAAKKVESRGRQAEAIVMEALKQWLPNEYIEHATEHDDGGGTDLYIEWKDPLSGEACVLSIDVTIGENIETLREKIENIARSLEFYDLRTIKYFKSADGSTGQEESVPGVAVFLPREPYREMKGGLENGSPPTFKDEYVEATVFMQIRSQLAYEIGMLSETFDLDNVAILKKSPDKDVRLFTKALEIFLSQNGDYDSDSQELADNILRTGVTKETLKKIDTLLIENDPEISKEDSDLISNSLWNAIKNYSATTHKLNQVKSTPGYRRKAKTAHVPRNLQALIKTPSRLASTEFVN